MPYYVAFCLVILICLSALLLHTFAHSWNITVLCGRLFISRILNLSNKFNADFPMFARTKSLLL